MFKQKELYMLIKRMKQAIVLLLIISLVICNCACNRKSEELNTDAYWYSCNSFIVPSVEGYSQDFCAGMYSDGFYYLAVYGAKIDEKKEGLENYYKLYKIDSDGNEKNCVTLPVECVNTCEQVILNDRLYCIEPNSNTEYVIDINNGDILSEERNNESVFGFYSTVDGYIKMTASSLIRYSKDGVENGRIDLRDTSIYMSFYQTEDGYYLVGSTNDKLIFYELDFNNRKIKKSLERPIADYYGYELRNGLFFSDKGVYHIDIKSKSFIPVTEWNYVDIKPAHKTTQYEVNLSYGNERFGMIYAYNDYEIELLIFNNIPAEKNADKKPITIGGYGVSTSLAIKWAVYNFNTSQDDYRIFLDDYWKEYSYTSGIEAQAQIVKLIKYFNEGNSPDIYYGTNFDYRYMYNAGLVVDMLPIMEKDPDFNIDSLVPSIKDAITKNGVCYQIFSAYYFDGDFGLKKNFNKKDVTYLSVDAMAKIKGISVRGDMPAAEFADQIIRYSLGDLIDRSSGSHVLSVDELKDIVEYSISNGIPYGSNSNYIADMDTVHDGTYLTCRRTWVGNLYDVAAIEREYNDSFVYLGFPSLYGSTHAAQPDGLVAISSDTKNQNICWQFIKYMLSDEVQEIEIGQSNNPVINKVFEDYCQYAANPGTLPETEIIWNSIINREKPVPEWIITDYKAMVNSVDAVISYDWGLYNIICDEINSYYLQNKSTDEIAKTLQSRIDLYVSENYK